MNINFKGFSKTEVIYSLWINTQYSGLGILRAKEGNLTDQEIQDVLKKNEDDITFLKGKPMFINLQEFPIINAENYDKYNKKMNGDNYFTMLDVKSNFIRSF